MFRVELEKDQQHMDQSINHKTEKKSKFFRSCLTTRMAKFPRKTREQPKKN